MIFIDIFTVKRERAANGRLAIVGVVVRALGVVDDGDTTIVKRARLVLKTISFVVKALVGGAGIRSIGTSRTIVIRREGALWFVANLSG